jgi:hypothetical protein
MPQIVYEIGDRVQVTRYYLKRQQSTGYNLMTTETVGVVQGYKAPKKGLACMVVRFFTNVPYPPHFERVMRADWIEPLGTKR